MSRESEYHSLLPALKELALEAGSRILEVYNSHFDVTHKDDRSPLTEADLAAHHTIVDGLEEITPHWPILSEESSQIAFSERSTWQRYWLVDPLDGTREFIKRNGEFTVNIALIEFHRPVMGVIYVPVSGMFYYAALGGGAYKQEQNVEPRRISTRPYRGGKVTVAGSRSHRGDSLDGFLTRIGDYEIISMGSSLKSCLVAEGRADIYPRFGPTSEWDTAAAQSIVEEAGGAVTDLSMQPLRYNTKESLLNPFFLVAGDPQQDWSRFLADT